MPKALTPRVSFAVPALVALAACACAPETPLALPSLVSAPEFGEATVDVWVFGVETTEAPSVVTDGTQLRRAEWQPERRGVTPVGARELRVVMVRPEGEFTVNGSNAIQFEAGDEARPVIRCLARAVPWVAGSRTVVVLKSFPDSVQLQTTSGAPLPSDAFDCRLAEEGLLRNRATFCTVRAAAPLSGEALAVDRVRARVVDLGDVEFTGAVEVP